MQTLPEKKRRLTSVRNWQMKTSVAQGGKEGTGEKGLKKSALEAAGEFGLGKPLEEFKGLEGHNPINILLRSLQLL